MQLKTCLLTCWLRGWGRLLHACSGFAGADEGGCLSQGEEGAAGPGVPSQSAAHFYMHMTALCIRTGPGQSASEHGVWS